VDPPCEEAQTPGGRRGGGAMSLIASQLQIGLFF
jgi:hypothetical protein